MIGDDETFLEPDERESIMKYFARPAKTGVSQMFLAVKFDDPAFRCVGKSRDAVSIFRMREALYGSISKFMSAIGNANLAE